MDNDVSGLVALIAELEAATDDDRDLADKVLKACGWTIRVDFPRPYPHEPAQTWIAPDGLEYDESVRPNPLASVDAALTLVPDGRDWIVEHANRHANHPVYASVADGKIYHARTPALALCIAALRSRQSLSGERVS